MQPLPLGELFQMYYQMYQALLLLGVPKAEALDQIADVIVGGSLG